MSRNFTPDETLIDQLLLDDTAAFEELHHRYCYSLYTYCLGKLNSTEDAREIVRDLFIDLWEKRHQLPVDYSISLHLYTEVRKAVVLHLNNTLQSNNNLDMVEKKIIPGFQLQQLKKARKPVSNNIPSTTVKRTYDTQQYAYLNKVLAPASFVSMKNLKYAFQKVLHLF